MLGKCTWKPKSTFSFSNDLFLVDGGGNTLARLTPAEWGKAGCLELISPVVQGGGVADEVVVTGIAVMQKVAKDAKDAENAADAVDVVSSVLGG